MKNKDKNKITGEITIVGRYCHYISKIDDKDYMIKTLFVKKGGKEIARIFKHCCKEVSLVIPDDICLTLDTLQDTILPIMKDYGKYWVGKEYKIG